MSSGDEIVANGEIACNEQFIHLPKCLQKNICCRGIRKPLYVGKGGLKTQQGTKTELGLNFF